MSRGPRLLLPFVAATIALAACGGDDDGSAGGASSPATSTGGGDAPDPAAGERVFNSKGCSSCHGNDIGPDLEGIYGTEVTLENGTTVTVDDAYIERSIRDPGAQKVDGYDVTMPSPNVNDEEVSQLVAYIRSLGESGDVEGTTP